jgi:hypothetical protein
MREGWRLPWLNLNFLLCVIEVRPALTIRHKKFNFGLSQLTFSPKLFHLPSAPFVDHTLITKAITMIKFARRGSKNNKSVQTNILEMIHGKKWKALRNLFASQLHQEQVAPHFLQEKNSSGGEGNTTMLHLCCQMNAPVDVVLMIHSVCPQAIELPDGLGRFPLHIAAKHGASPYVVRFLVDKYAQAAAVQDMNGMTPLHLCCESYMKNFKPIDGEDVSRQEATEAVVTMLCKAAPQAVNVEDKNDMSAIEYAIDSDCPLRAIKKIQKTSEKAWKKSQSNMSLDLLQKENFTDVPVPVSQSGSAGRRSSSMRRSSIMAISA